VYGEGLYRIVHHPGMPPDVASRLLDDKLLAHLLVLHGLHPDSAEQRIQHALEEVRPYLDSHGGDVNLEAINNGVATITLASGGCASSAASTATAVRDAVLIAAPELADVEARTPPREPAQAFIPVEALLHPSEVRR
jgi:Fe-S cluster biogenesis protein NfuA